MYEMKSIAVFCGSGHGNNPLFTDTARELGSILAEKQITLIYGGARVGLMGEVANACLHRGGKVIGVIPEFLSQKELLHEGLTEIFITKSMHERKAKMEELADGFIAIPGGFGTLDELFEILTWAQLGLHSKPIGLINTDQFYTPLLAMLNQMEKFELIKPLHKKLLLHAESIEDILLHMQSFSPTDLPKWNVKV